MSDRPVWVNLVSGFLVFAGILGLTSWAFLAWFSWEKGSMDESIAGAMVHEADGWIVATTESGEVVFEGPAEEFEDRSSVAQRSYQTGLLVRRLLPALGLIVLGSAVWYLRPRVTESKERV